MRPHMHTAASPSRPAARDSIVALRGAGRAQLLLIESRWHPGAPHHVAMNRAARRVLRSRRRRGARSTVGPPSEGPSPWAAAPPLKLPWTSGRAAPLIVVNEYAALLASGVSPATADALMTGARHGIWALGVDTKSQQQQGEAASCIRRADA